MKKFFISALIPIFLLLTGAVAQGLEFGPQPSAVIGLRFGAETLNTQRAGYFGVKMALFSHSLKDFQRMSLMSLGLNYQSDGNFSLSLSPISVVSLSGLSFGLDLFYKEKDTRGGNIGLFAGAEF